MERETNTQTLNLAQKHLLRGRQIRTNNSPNTSNEIWNCFSQSSAYRGPSLLNPTEARAADSEMEVHFVAAGVLTRKIMPIFTPVGSQGQATSHLAILKGHWTDVANIHLALNELLQCMIL